MDTSDMTAKRSLSATNMNITYETLEHSLKTTDTTLGKYNLLKNLANNLCMAKYPY